MLLEQLYLACPPPPRRSREQNLQRAASQATGQRLFSGLSRLLRHALERGVGIILHRKETNAREVIFAD